MNLQNITVSERNQSQATTCCTIPVIWNIQYEQSIETESIRVVARDWGNLGEGEERRLTASWVQDLRLQWWKVLELNQWQSHHTANALHVTESHSFTWLQWYICMYFTTIFKKRIEWGSEITDSTNGNCTLTKERNRVGLHTRSRKACVLMRMNEERQNWWLRRERKKLLENDLEQRRKRKSITGGRGWPWPGAGAFHPREDGGRSMCEDGCSLSVDRWSGEDPQRSLSETQGERSSAETENGEEIWIVLYEWGEWLNQGNTVQPPRFSESYSSPIFSETVSCPCCFQLCGDRFRIQSKWASPGLWFSQLWWGVICVSMTGLQCPNLWSNIILNVSERVLGGRGRERLPFKLVHFGKADCPP